LSDTFDSFRAVAVKLVTIVAALLLMIAADPAVAPAAAAGQQAERVEVGDTAIDFTLQSIDGQTYRLGDLRGEKTAIIIFFRGTW
jgi:cytochrome oxidase Cu insertion factor (SCO1/SenC/PrrC family)